MAKHARADATEETPSFDESAPVAAPSFEEPAAKKKRKWPLVVIPLVVLALVAGGIAFALNQKPAPEPKADPKPVSSAKVSDPAPKTSSEPASEPEPEPVPDPFYVLVVGNDIRTGTAQTTGHGADGTSRSDTMMLVRVDPGTFQITILTIPRDTRSTILGPVTKLNEAYNAGGMAYSVMAVEQLTGRTVPYYMNMTFRQFADFIDSIGGIDANVPVGMSLTNIFDNVTEIYLEPGEQHLDGAQALVLMRQRKQYGGNQDAMRQINDRAMVETIIRRVLSAGDAEVEFFTRAIMSQMETNFTEEQLLELVHRFVQNADKVTFYLGTAPYDGGADPETGAWLCYPAEETWAELMNVIDAGGDPNTVVVSPSF